MNLRQFTPITFLWLAGLVSNLIGWVFTMFANRMLTIEEMGHLAVYVQILTLVSIGSVAIGTTANRFFIEKSDKTRESVIWLAQRAAILGIVITCSYIISYPWWSHFFQVTQDSFLLFTSSALFTIMFLLAWARGVLHARNLFIYSGIVLIIESSSKLIFPFIHGISLPSLEKFLLAQPISAGIALLLIFAPLLKMKLAPQFFKPAKVSATVKKFLTHALIQRAGIVALISIDILLAKHYLSPREAGIYAIVSLIGKMIFFATQSIYTVMTPLLAPHINSPTRRRRRYLLVNVVMGFVIITMICAFILLPSLSLVPLLGPSRYALITPYVFKYSIASGTFGIIFISSAYQLLKKQYFFSTLLIVACIAEAILISLYHQTIHEIINATLSISLLTASASTLGLLRNNNQSKRILK